MKNWAIKHLTVIFVAFSAIPYAEFFGVMFVSAELRPFMLLYI